MFHPLDCYPYISPRRRKEDKGGSFNYVTGKKIPGSQGIEGCSVTIEKRRKIPLEMRLPIRMQDQRSLRMITNGIAIVIMEDQIMI
jgi:hypothetical protein